MYKKLWIITTICLALVVAFGVVGVPTQAAAGDYTYQVKITRNGEPMSGAYVRLAGVGVELTNASGIAIFDVSDAPGRGQGRQQLFRGPLYAALKGKASGAVTDEYNVIRVIVSSHDIGENPGTGPSFTMGTEIFIKLNVVYTIDI